MYEILAQYYDLFAQKQEWIDFAVRAVKNKKRGADVGCGTGNVALALSDEHDIVAIDPSEQMLAVASRKFLSAGKKIPAIRQKAEALKLNFEADFITAMCDVVNYIKEPCRFFRAAYENLRVGGLLVFDISSENKLRQVIGNNVFTDTADDVTYIWENSLSKDHVDMTLTFFIPNGDGSYGKAIDYQRQYIHTSSDISAKLVQCGFTVKAKDKGDRMYFVATKGK